MISIAKLANFISFYMVTIYLKLNIHFPKHQLCVDVFFKKLRNDLKLIIHVYVEHLSDRRCSATIT